MDARSQSVGGPELSSPAALVEPVGQATHSWFSFTLSPASQPPGTRMQHSALVQPGDV